MFQVSNLNFEISKGLNFKSQMFQISNFKSQISNLKFEITNPEIPDASPERGEVPG